MACPPHSETLPCPTHDKQSHNVCGLASVLRSVWRQCRLAQVLILLTLGLGGGFAQVKVTGTATLAGSVQAMAGGKHSVLLTWSAAQIQDITFRVYRSTSSGSGYQLMQSLISCGHYTDFNVTNSTTYYYVVTAYNSSANSESAYSNQVPIVIGN